MLRIKIFFGMHTFYGSVQYDLIEGDGGHCGSLDWFDFWVGLIGKLVKIQTKNLKLKFI